MGVPAGYLQMRMQGHSSALHLGHKDLILVTTLTQNSRLSVSLF